MISFTIGQRILAAEEGMTLDQWVDSDYNTIGLMTNGDLGYYSTTYSALLQYSQNYGDTVPRGTLITDGMVLELWVP